MNRSMRATLINPYLDGEEFLYEIINKYELKESVN
jgi:hypothetical protein